MPLKGPRNCPPSLKEGPNAINSYIAGLIIHAAKVERAAGGEVDEFRWSISEDMEFRGTIVSKAAVTIVTKAALAV